LNSDNFGRKGCDVRDNIQGKRSDKILMQPHVRVGTKTSATHAHAEIFWQPQKKETPL
jgi:hypothetical protein